MYACVRVCERATTMATVRMIDNDNDDDGNDDNEEDDNDDGDDDDLL